MQPGAVDQPSSGTWKRLDVSPQIRQISGTGLLSRLSARALLSANPLSRSPTGIRGRTDVGFRLFGEKEIVGDSIVLSTPVAAHLRSNGTRSSRQPSHWLDQQDILISLYDLTSTLVVSQ